MTISEAQKLIIESIPKNIKRDMLNAVKIMGQVIKNDKKAHKRTGDKIN